MLIFNESYIYETAPDNRIEMQSQRAAFEALREANDRIGGEMRSETGPGEKDCFRTE